MSPGESDSTQSVWKTILRFQVGDASAIRRILGSRNSLLIGSILVITAGIARRYDQESLISDLRWLYLPFIVAGISSFLVFASVWIFGIRPGRKVAGIEPSRLRFWPSYLDFLGAFLMTAPLAWLYAIPVESHTDLFTAAKWNTAFLAIVSLWRVVLITRVLQVGWGIPFWHTLLAVLLPASAEAWVGAINQSLNLVGLMGGIVLPPHVQFLRDVSNLVANVSFFAFLAAISILLLLSGFSPRTRGFRPEAFEPAVACLQKTRVRLAPAEMLTFPLICLAAWLALAVTPQVRVWRFDQFERLADASQYAEAIGFLRARQRTDFPPDYLMTKRGWFTRDQIVELIRAIRPDETPWIRESLFTLARPHVEGFLNSWRGGIEDGALEFFQAIASIPGGPEWFEAFVRDEPVLISDFFDRDKNAANPEFDLQQAAIRDWLISIGIEPADLES